ncbi:DUF6777 domain-containing protein [Kitasatospora sp. NPDC059577]|uniref:DUF6777 domain-containing protein n=1 Tax=Kitasatospora sp. NPDC059577 TaxID=3346873 RepID=UPI00367C8D18
MVATVLIVSNQGSHTEAIPAANEVALQAPADPGPAPFTPSVETQGMTAPAPATSAAQQPGGASPHPGGATSKGGSPATLHSVEGSSAGLYGAQMGKSSCDTERLIGMVSGGDTGRAWASAAGIAQADIPAYLRSLTSAYLRVDTRVTNHSYKSGAVAEYQSVLQAGTAVLVDSHGVPRVRCACGNPLGPPKLMSNAKYTGKAWTGFQPSSLIVVVPAPQPVTEIVLVNVETGGWFARLTGRIEVVDKGVEPPKVLVPGVPPPAPWQPSTPSGSGKTSGPTTSGPTTSSSTTSGSTTSGSTTSGSTTSGSTTSGSTSSGSTTSGSTTSGPTTSGPTTSGATTSSGGPSSSSATTSTGTPPATKSTSSAATATATTGTPTSAVATTTTGKPTVTSTSVASTTISPKTPTAT